MAIGAYGIMNRLLVLYVMIVLGLTMGMQPIVGYNFGAQKYDRVKATLRLSILTGVCITSTGFIICELFPHAVSAVFTSDGQLIDMASRGVRICKETEEVVSSPVLILINRSRLHSPPRYRRTSVPCGVQTRHRAGSASP